MSSNGEFRKEDLNVVDGKNEKKEKKREENGNRNLTARDFEILRTVARLRYVTSRELRNVFFSYDDSGRKRLKILSAQDLIRPHCKGLPKHLGYSVWRLTTRGLNLIHREFPTEEPASMLVERAAEGSLFAIEHREQLARVYLELISQNRSHQTGEDVSPTDIATMRQRANQFGWHADGDVVLRFTDLGRKLHIVPDALVTSRVRPTRLFIECDRSTKSLTRIKEDLKDYERYFRSGYRNDFDDGRKGSVVYVVRSPERKASISKMVVDNWLGVRPHVLVSGHTTEWLEQHLLDPALATSRPQETAKEMLGKLWHASRDALDYMKVDHPVFEHHRQEKFRILEETLNRLVSHVG